MGRYAHEKKHVGSDMFAGGFVCIYVLKSSQ